MRYDQWTWVKVILKKFRYMLVNAFIIGINKQFDQWTWVMVSSHEVRYMLVNKFIIRDV
jgi:hypothetical protein